MTPILYPEFPPIAIISALILLIPLPWHWRARNVATLSIILWLFMSNIIYATDAIIWKDNVLIKARVWCDITTKLMIGINLALPAACLCICMHLEHVASARPGPLFMAGERRRCIFELVMCFGLPIIFMGLHYVVQGHRFDILQGYGCRPSTYFSIPALFVVWIPPLILASIGIVYSVLALRHFLVRRLTFATLLNSSKTALTTSRYLRLMLMAALQMIWSISVTSYNLWFTFSNMTLRPWTTWADVHSNFGRIDQYPALLMPPNVAKAYYASWLVIPISSWLFVAFFAFGRDAVEEYKKCFKWIRTRFIRVVHLQPRKRNTSGFTTLTTTQFNGLPISSPKPINDTLSPNPTSSIYKSADTSIDDMTDYFCHYTPATLAPHPLPYMPYTKRDGYSNDLAHETVAPKTSTVQPSITPLTPPPPPRRPRLRGLSSVERIPPPIRPVTYPSQDAYYRGFDLAS